MSNLKDLTMDKINEVRMGLNLVEGDEYRETLAAISEVVSDVLGKTLGPYAYTTTIDDGAYTYSTKDGWSVLNRLRFGDVVHETLFKFIKQISFQLNSRVGDGTTTAVIAADFFTRMLREFMATVRYDDNGDILRQADLLNCINECKDKIIEELHSPKRLHMVKRGQNGYEDIYKIAYVSANRNATIAKIIKDIYDQTDNPNIHVTLNSNQATTYGEVQRGYKLDAKLLMAECYVNTEDKTSVITDDSMIFIFNHNVTYAEHFTLIQQLITLANQTKKVLIIVAPYFDEVITSILSATISRCAQQGQVPNTMIVQCPMASQSQKNYIDDFAILTNAEIFTYTYVRMYNQLVKQYNAKLNNTELDDEFDEYKGLLENSDFEAPGDIVELCKGVTHKITLSEKMMLLENFAVDSNRYTTRKAEILETFEEVKNKFKTSSSIDPLNKEYLEAHMRYVKFMGNTGVIHVGGDSDLVRQCDKDSIDDAVLACRSAFENGYIRGLNLETISVAQDLGNQCDVKHSVEKEIYKIFERVFRATSMKVMANKYDNYSSYTMDAPVWKNYNGLDNHISAVEVLDTCIENNLCFDIVTESYQHADNEEELTLVNSVSTDCEILTAMTSILSLLLSSNQLLSINKTYYRTRSKAKVLSEEADKAAAWGEGISRALIKNGSTMFYNNLVSDGHVPAPVTLDKALENFNGNVDTVTLPYEHKAEATPEIFSFKQETVDRGDVTLF